MTRINCGIPVKELTDKHLIAEHREIIRIPNAVKKGKFSLKGKPDYFCLGKGHVKFFYDKLGYLHKRYAKLYNECKVRGFKVQDYSESWDDVPFEYMKDYKPMPIDRIIVRERISTRLKEADLKSKKP